LLDKPSATRSAICASRFVKDRSNAESPIRFLRARLNNASTTSGEHGLSPRAARLRTSTSWWDDASHERNPDTPAPAQPRRSSSWSGATSATTLASPAAEAISRATRMSARWVASTRTTSGSAPPRSREGDSAVLAAPASVRPSSVATRREMPSRYTRMSEATKTRTVWGLLIDVFAEFSPMGSPCPDRPGVPVTITGVGNLGDRRHRRRRTTAVDPRTCDRAATSACHAPPWWSQLQRCLRCGAGKYPSASRDGGAASRADLRDQARPSRRACRCISLIQHCARARAVVGAGWVQRSEPRLRPWRRSRVSH